MDQVPHLPPGEPDVLSGFLRRQGLGDHVLLGFPEPLLQLLGGEAVPALERGISEGADLLHFAIVLDRDRPFVAAEMSDGLFCGSPARKTPELGHPELGHPELGHPELGHMDSRRKSC